MAENFTIKKAIELIERAIKERKTVNQICLEEFNGKSRNYVANLIWELDEKLQEGKITKEDYNEITNIWSEYIEKKQESSSKPSKQITPTPTPKSKQQPTQEIEESVLDPEELEYDAFKDDKYEERSYSEMVRDSEEAVVIDKTNGITAKKITGYRYKIYIRDENALEGEFTREEMDLVYRLYSNLDGAGLTQRAVSRHFKHLTFRDFKRILRAFNITKQSIPVAPHIIEENDDDKVVKIVFKNKEDNVLKKLEDERGKKLEVTLRETQRELIELKKRRTDLKHLFNGVSFVDIEPFYIKKSEVFEEKALMVYISDQHVGAFTEEDSIYNNEYNAEEFERRMTECLTKVIELKNTFGHFEKICICNLGDPLDGFDNETVRGSHKLPQNMNNKKQFNVYLQTMLRFFDTLYKSDVCNEIEYHCVTDDNHSGDMGYFANKALEMALKLKYPKMNVNILEKFIEHIQYGNHTFILTHGKDKIDMRGGFPLTLDNKTEVYFNDYIDSKKIFSHFFHVVSGDLHQSALTFGKRIRYKKVMSMYGSSKWIHTNFGNTKAGCDYEIVCKHTNDILEGRIYF